MSMVDCVAICSAAGINVRSMELTDVYQTAGKILNDFEVAKLAREYRNASILACGTTAAALSKMSLAERAALRERVLSK